MPSQSAAFDYGSSLRRMGDDVELFREMVGLLQADGPRRLEELRHGIDARDAGQVVHAAHTLKGLAANFSAARAVKAAACIEQLARHTDWAGIRKEIASLEEALAELQSELRPFIAQAAESA